MNFRIWIKSEIIERKKLFIWVSDIVGFGAFSLNLCIFWIRIKKILFEPNALLIDDFYSFNRNPDKGQHDSPYEAVRMELSTNKQKNDWNQINDLYFLHFIRISHTFCPMIG